MNEGKILEQGTKEPIFVEGLVSLAEDIELKTPNSRYCVIEDANTYKGYCNGFLQEYEKDLLQKELKKVNVGNDLSLPVEISANIETGLSNIRLANGEIKQNRYKNLVIECGADGAWKYTLRMKMADTETLVPMSFVKSGTMKKELGQSAEGLFSTVTSILRRRINNTALVEIRVI